MAEATVIEAAREAGATLRPVSPAAHLAARFAAAEVTGARTVRIREVPFLTMVGIRVQPDGTTADRLATSLGAALPTGCGAVSSGEGVSVLWLSPDEFLVVSDRQPEALTAALVDALAGDVGSVTDLSANRTTFELGGSCAREVLEKGCTLDLHPRVFETGSAYVSAIGSVPVIVWKTGEELYRVLPRASFADFLGRWLLDAMTEFNAPEIS